MRVFKILFIVICLTGFLNAQVAVIANKSIKKDKINKTELLDCYTGDLKKLDDKQKIHVFDLKEKTDTKDIFYKYLGKSAARMKSIWMKRMLSGEGEPPPALESEEEMLKKVKNTKGAIGFINYEKVTNEVKVLLIIDEKE